MQPSTMHRWWTPAIRQAGAAHFPMHELRHPRHRVSTRQPGRPRPRQRFARHRRPVLEELVREAVNRELVALVEAELAAVVERRHGRDGTPAHAELGSPIGDVANEALPVELCSRCYAEPRLPDRTIGRRCKTDDDARVRAKRRERKSGRASSTSGSAQAGSGDDESRPTDSPAVDSTPSPRRRSPQDRSSPRTASPPRRCSRSAGTSARSAPATSNGGYSTEASPNGTAPPTGSCRPSSASRSEPRCTR
jgi:hypothetical protein